MKRAAGFTLIELVIVIVILGILGAVAAPRFFNLQGDAYGANLNSMRSNIQSAMTMANAKALIEGKVGVGENDEAITGIRDYDGIDFKYGYPVADSTVGSDNKGILKTLDSFDYERYNLNSASGALTITPKSIDNTTNCVVTYTEASKNSDGTIQSATVTATTDKC